MGYNTGGGIASRVKTAPELQIPHDSCMPELLAAQAESGRTSALRRLGVVRVTTRQLSLYQILQEGEEQLLLCLSMYLQCAGSSEADFLLVHGFSLAPRPACF